MRWPYSDWWVHNVFRKGKYIHVTGTSKNKMTQDMHLGVLPGSMVSFMEKPDALVIIGSDTLHWIRPREGIDILNIGFSGIPWPHTYEGTPLEKMDNVP